MRVVKIPISNQLLIDFLHLDSTKYSLHSATQDPNNPTVTNLFILGEDLPEIEYGKPVPEADIQCTTKYSECCGRKEIKAELQVKPY